MIERALGFGFRRAPFDKACRDYMGTRFRVATMQYQWNRN